MSDALENAFVIVLGQSCLLLAKTIISIVFLGNTTEATFIVLLFSLVNITCIISNWVSCRQKGEDTTDLSFFVDILTLSVFFVVTYVFTEYAQNMNVGMSLRVVSGSYICIHVLYIVWNTIMLAGDPTQNYFLMNTNYLNIVSIVLYAMVFGFSYVDLHAAIAFFILLVLYWFYVLAKYMKELDAKPVETYITRATWYTINNGILKQYITSIWSYLSYPFSKTSREGAQRYFASIYEGRKTDDLIFAGNQTDYYDILSPVIDKRVIRDTIIDIGCGDATLFHWLKDNNIKFKKYVGVDFAITTRIIDANAIIKRQNAARFTMSYEPANLVIMVNSICYMSDEALKRMLRKLKYADDIVVVEPKKGLFWDAYFEDVKIYYRSEKELIRIFINNGFELKKRSYSYGINKLKYHHFIKLSYCLVFKRI